MDEPRTYQEDDIVTNAQGAQMQLINNQWVPVQSQSRQKMMENLMMNPSGSGFEGGGIPRELTQGQSGLNTVTGATMGGLHPSLIGKGVGGLLQGVTKFFRRPIGREEMIQSVVQGVGGKGSSAAQALEVAPEIRAAYDIANQSGNVPASPIAKSLDQAYQRIKTYDPKTATYLKDRIMSPYFEGGDALYEQVINDSQEVNRLASASKDPIVATALRNARNGMIDAMDTVSPAARAANNLVRQNTARQDITEIMRNRGPKAGLAMRQMLEQEEGTRNVLGLTSPQRYNQFVKEVDQVAATTLTPESKAERLVQWLKAHPWTIIGPLGGYEVGRHLGGGQYGNH